jgi:hypothetical protein
MLDDFSPPPDEFIAQQGQLLALSQWLLQRRPINSRNVSCLRLVRRQDGEKLISLDDIHRLQRYVARSFARDDGPISFLSITLDTPRYISRAIQ